MKIILSIILFIVIVSLPYLLGRLNRKHKGVDMSVFNINEDGFVSMYLVGIWWSLILVLLACVFTICYQLVSKILL